MAGRVAGKGRTCGYLHISTAVHGPAAALLRPVAGKGNGGLLHHGAGINRSALGEAAHRIVVIGGGTGERDPAVIQRAAAVAGFIRIAGTSACIDQHIRQQKRPGKEGGGPKGSPGKAQTAGKNGKTTCFLHKSCPVGERFTAGWEPRRRHRPGPFLRDRQGRFHWRLPQGRERRPRRNPRPEDRACGCRPCRPPGRSW